MEPISGSAGTTQASEGVRAQLAEKKRETESLTEMIREAREKTEAHRKSLRDLYKKTQNTRYGDAPIEAYSRLARAKNAAQVNAASGYARRRIAQLKQALREDTDNRPSIQAAINQLQKTINRAGRKKSELAREKTLEAQCKRRAEEEQRQREQRLRMELRQRKARRMLRESGYLREAAVDAKLHAQVSQSQMEMREQARQLGAQVSPEQAAAQYAAAMEAPTPAPEISGQA